MTEAAGTTQAKTTNYTYHSNAIDLVTTITKPSVSSGHSAVTTIGYNSDLMPVSITQAGFRPDGSSVSRTIMLGYNGRGQITSIDGPRTDVSDITTLSYHDCTSGGECGQLASITNALSHTTAFNAYDGAGRIKTMTDPWGVVTTYSYDDLGRLIEIKQTPQSGPVRTTGYSYNAIGKLASVTTPAGTVLTYAYDNAHDLISVSDNLGNAVKYKYDLSGNRIEEKVTDSGNNLVHTIQKTYDVRNNLQTINNGGSLTQLVHDAIGNLVSHTDANNHVTTNDFNALNQLTQTIDALTNPTNYSYDKQDNIVTVQSPNNGTTTYAYDDLGNLVSEISPDRGTTLYTVDAAGNVLSHADARGVTVSMTYDALNRVLTRGYPGTVEDVAYVYDNCSQGIGRLCSVQDQSGTTAYTYDPFGNVTTRIQTVLGINYTTQFAYNTDDRLTKVTYPTEHVINYTRDVLGRITAANLTVNGQTSPVISSVSYTADGLLAEQTFGNGLLETRSHDAKRRLSTWQISGLFSRTNTYDAVGNMLSRTLNSGTQNFTYDAMDRLLTDFGVGTNYTFTYDGNGNLLTADAGGVQSQCGYEFGSNRMNFLDGAPVLLDAAGNTLVQRGVTMTYNQASRLATVGNIGPFTYNAEGQRTTKPAPTGTTVFHYGMDGQLLAETTDAGSLIRVYFWAEDMPIAQIDTELTYLHADHLDTPRIGTNSSGAIVWQWNSDAFGSLLPNEDPDNNGIPTTVNLRFPGQYFDKETNLHYNYFRDYDPRIGRYLESDPIGLEGGLNTFGYVSGNPVKYYDPFGLAEFPNDFIGPLPPDGYYTSEMTQTRCGKIPPAPSHADINKNMLQARNSWNPKWFYSQVRNKGPWDYKQQGQNRKYEDFGNFNFGATGTAFGIPEIVLHRGAGMASQIADPQRKNLGNFWGKYPYGDDPNDLKQISKGKKYCECMGY
ncbi:RHS repeat-associated protein [Nitrosomonas oligotropha]|uniref:RHS repeat-associated protein n=1 Tax=Nitrosomonas oligotropha TaxID=42354 RepID=A0A2T5H4Q6_9PROT|nr:RHS repeat-associated core domain-containing protein [Nitrosomonas oligotropha]PTQ66540.1 RHS repeat-associated protein [Nitrosomonas oligotropha]